ncbi:putative P-type cation-transporting ATPase [Pseudovirgaria hyperparasitica]|uniref:Putative P-type cation-transporting ATPase n=1 Tax=Pseudovirgaria hyperparasitica TaxID=470096 RepID=A0A6A6WBV4_9PEZI|nr:putative P-type cation-transporting ATPase [Pseudovirgaria hyperparasitica]KAF2760312.1 putative P-type cation-transporting ATPase [Pseudovirgaria hyperparasitica]
MFLEDILDSGPVGVDTERGSGAFEKVVLSVQGMTCSGCEKKLIKAFRRIPTIRNEKTSQVLARAEYEIDISVISIDESISQLKRVTSYSFEQLADDIGQALEILSGHPDALMKVGQCPGVQLVDRPDNNNPQLLRIYYNAAEVGARDLLEHRLADIKPRLAPPQAHPSLIAGKKQVRRDGGLFFISAFLTLPVLVFSWAPIPHKGSVVYQVVSLVAASLIQVGVAFEFYPSAFKSLFRSRVIEMDLLIVLSTTAAYAFSVTAFAFMVSGNALETGTFFETSTLLATLILLGRFISELARQKATESISIRSLQTQTAILIDNGNRNVIRVVDARLLQFGDTFRVMPHSSVVTDGIVVYGGSEVNESMVTGEPIPVAKAKDSHVLAGSMNGTGNLDVKLVNLPGQNTISAIADMVDAAELTKPRSQAIADTVAGYFVPVIVAITLIVFVTWVLVGILIQHISHKSAAVNALTYAIATLIISCPCAIGLAVPMVVVIAGGVAAKYGVVFKSPQTIEIARKTTDVVFDKTGTLTQGRMSVVRQFYLGFEKSMTEGFLLGMTQDAKHPVSIAIAEALAASGVKPNRLDSIDVIPGCGIEGRVQDSQIRAGNARWLHVETNTHVQAMLREGLTTFCVEYDQYLVAIFGLRDTIRPEAPRVVRELKERGIMVHILSGDDDIAVRHTATVLNIDSENVVAGAGPADKQAYVRSLTEKKPGSTVIFCGDGTNDAVALAQATLGIHINSGSATEVAKSAADVVLVRPDLQGVITAIDISRSAFRRILFNFGWSAVYNVFAILLAAGAFVAAFDKARIRPEFAGLGEIASVLPVIVIAFTMKYFNYGR